MNVYLLQGSVNFRLVILGEYTFITCEKGTTRVLELMEPKNLPRKRSDLNLVNFLLQRALYQKVYRYEIRDVDHCEAAGRAFCCIVGSDKPGRKIREPGRLLKRGATVIKAVLNSC